MSEKRHINRVALRRTSELSCSNQSHLTPFLIAGVGKSLKDTLLANDAEVKHSLHNSPVSVWSNKMNKVRMRGKKNIFSVIQPLLKFKSTPQTDFRRQAEDPEAQ